MMLIISIKKKKTIKVKNFRDKKNSEIQHAFLRVYITLSQSHS